VYEVTIVGSGVSHGRVPNPEGTPFEVARQLLMLEHCDDLTLPDSTEVVLLDFRTESYTPPRCRKPRKRHVRTEVARFTLGDLRTPSLKADLEGGEG
jgi:hypothetical protein